MPKRIGKFHTIFGATVIAIPDSGLFVRDGRIYAGHEAKPMPIEEMPLFSREEDAERHARDRAREHREKFPEDTHDWNFVVVPVLVSER